MSIHVVLVHPEIHWNTGNAGRTCLAAGATLHLIEPLGFSLDEREVRRAGLDYWEHVDLRVWPTGKRSRASCRRSASRSSSRRRRSVCSGTRRSAPRDDVVLIFGRETGGLPPDMHERYRDRIVAMPILSPHVRSLNLSTCVGIALYEVLRQRRTLA